MKLFAVLCVFVASSYASAATIPQDDGPSYQLKRVDERNADADAYADAISDAVASAIAEAGGFAGPNTYAQPIALANPKAVALPDGDAKSGPGGFGCYVPPSMARWWRVDHFPCANSCVSSGRGRWKGGRCVNGACVCG